MFPIKKPNEFVYFESQLGLARYLEVRELSLLDKNL